MQAIPRRPELELQVVAAGTMVLERFQQPVHVVKEDGFQIDGEVYIELEGSTPATMAKSVGFGVVEFASEFQRLKPDLVLLIGDRYETLCRCHCCRLHEYLHRAHPRGRGIGFDRRKRAACDHEICHFHFPSTHGRQEYLVRMGEDPEHHLGNWLSQQRYSSSSTGGLAPEVVNDGRQRRIIDVSQPFLLVVFHPTTTEYGGERQQMEELLKRLASEVQSILLWPNIDAGADHISKAIRVYRDQRKPAWLPTPHKPSPRIT